MGKTDLVRRIHSAGIVLAVLAAAVLAGCGSGGGSTDAATATGAPVAKLTGRETVPLKMPARMRGGELSSPHQLEVPKGWTASVWARVPGARMEAVTPEGNLLVSVPGEGKVVELSGKGMATKESVILAGLESPQGLAFAERGGGWVLYVGESDQIDSYPWTGGAVGKQTVIAPDLPDETPAGDDIHRQKDVVVAPDGTVYFDVGSSSNASPADRGYDPPRGVIDSVGPDGGKVTVVMRGVRNGEGLALAPDGTIWTAINNRDEIPYPFHGEAFGPERSVRPGDPRLRRQPSARGGRPGQPGPRPRLAALQSRTGEVDAARVAGERAADPGLGDQSRRQGTRLLEARTDPGRPPRPLGAAGMSFLQGTKVPAPWSGGAVLAAHGSWDRQEPRPPAVLWLRWDAKKKTLLPAKTLIGGFQESNGERWGRPVDAVPGPEGALYVSTTRPAPSTSSSRRAEPVGVGRAWI